MSDMLPYIDHYFNNELSAEEKQVFEGRCLSDPAFARMVAFYISMHKHSQQQWTERKKKQFAQLEVAAFPADETSFSGNNELGIIEHHDEQKMGFPDKKSNEKRETEQGKLLKKSTSSIESSGDSLIKNAKIKPIRTWKKLAVAAALSGVITTGITWYIQNTAQQDIAVAVNHKKTEDKKSNPAANPSSAEKNTITAQKQNTTKKEVNKEKEQQQLYASYFVPDAAPENQEGPYEDAYAYFEMKKYKEAVKAIENADLNITTRETGEELTPFYGNYYKALSYMADGNVPKAIPELKEAIAKGADGPVQSINSSLQIKAQWYLALAYLKTGNLKRAEELLNTVSSNKHEKEYKTKAAALLNELKRSEKQHK